MFTEFKKKDFLSLGQIKKTNLDHILVRDYVKEIDIGAFQSEFGVKQRVSFNVILEVTTNHHPKHDNVDLVLSYDNIIEIIEDEIAQKRFALLETLAEHIALSCLCLESVISVTVRLEKLDRGIGKLGVQISRTKAETNNSKTNNVEANSRILQNGNLVIKSKIPNAGLLFVSNKMLLAGNINHFKNFISKSKKTWVICLSEIFSEFSEMNPTKNIEILTMAIAQNAFRLNKTFNNWKLARSKTEVAFLLKDGVTCLWCPSNAYEFSKKDIFLDKEFALNMACHLTNELLMKQIYLFPEDKLSEVLIEDIRKKGVSVEFCAE